MASGADQPRGREALWNWVVGAPLIEHCDRRGTEGAFGAECPQLRSRRESPSGPFRLWAGLSLASLGLAVWQSDSRVPLLLAKPGLRLSEPRAGDITPREASGRRWSWRKRGPVNRLSLPFPGKVRGAEALAGSKAPCLASFLFPHWARVEVRRATGRPSYSIWSSMGATGQGWLSPLCVLCPPLIPPPLGTAAPNKATRGCRRHRFGMARLPGDWARSPYLTARGTPRRLAALELS